jgi:hypothetical protein
MIGTGPIMIMPPKLFLLSPRRLGSLRSSLRSIDPENGAKKRIRKPKMIMMMGIAEIGFVEKKNGNIMNKPTDASPSNEKTTSKTMPNNISENPTAKYFIFTRNLLFAG